MDYEVERRKSLKWRILFWSIALPVFVAIALVIILFAFGYRYNFKEKKIYLTSVLYVNSLPSGAKFYLNGKYLGKTKSIINGVKPGNYKIRLEKEGFLPWEANIEVAAYSLVEISPSLFYQKPISEHTLTYDRVLDYKNDNLLFLSDQKVFLKNLNNIKDEPIALNLKDLNFSKAILGENNSSLFDFGTYWEIIDENNTSSKILKPKDTLEKIICVGRVIYFLNSKKELWQIDENSKTMIADRVLDTNWQNGKLETISESNKLTTKGIGLAQEKSGSLKVENNSLKPIAISSLKFCRFNSKTVCLYRNKEFFILVNNGLYWLGDNLQSLTEQDEQIAWLDDEGSIHLYSAKDKTTKFISRYFDAPKNIYFFSPNYLLLQFDKEVKMLEIQTKQEFKILPKNQSFDYISPLSLQYISLIGKDEATTFKITEAQSLWDKILQTFRK